MPPTNASTTLSVRSCRTMRHRPPPMAERIAISRRRVVARASNRFARLTHPISNTKITDPRTTYSGVRKMRPVVGALLRGEDKRRKELRSQSRQIRLAWGNAGGGMRLTVETNRSTDNRRVASEAPAPQAVTEHDQPGVACD